MDGIETGGTPVASTETAASPAAMAESQVSTDANQSAQPVADATQAPSVPAEVNGQSSAAAQDDFPDDDALAAMPGEERKSHWQQVRSRIDELNQQKAELAAQLQQFQQQPPQAAQSWVSDDLLFAPQIDPRTGQPVVDAFGEPITSPAPFLERLRNESPTTYSNLLVEALNQPFSADETTARVLFRDYYGLNPDLFDTYRQIQSPEDAQAYMPAGDMSLIPQAYHELYKSLDWETRDQIDSITDDAARALALRGLNAEFQQKQAEQARNQEIAAERQRVQQERSAQLGREIAVGARELVRQQFGKAVQFTGDPKTDDLLWGVLMSYGENQLLEDAQGKQVIHKLFDDKNGLVTRGEAHLARSQQALLATNAARLMKEPLEMFSQMAAKARKYDELQRQNAAPRAEIGANGANGFSQQPANNNGLQQQQHGRSSLFNAEEVAQLAAQIRATQGG